MSSFSAPPLPPPPPLLPPPLPSAVETRGAHISRLHAVATDGLSWCVSRYKSATHKNPDVPRLALGVLVVASAGVAALGLASALSPNAKVFVVNFCGFVYPATATIRAAKKRTTPRDDGSPGSRLSPAYSGYWVLFGLSSVFDSILPTVAPCYFFSKACLLAWGVSSTRPYGGRVVTSRMIEFMNSTSSEDNKKDDDDDNDNDDDPVRRRLVSVSESVARTGLLPPIKPSTLAVATVVASIAAATLALGICSWLVLNAEAFFSSRSSRLQAAVCAVAGAFWPLYATLVALARAGAAGGAAGVGDGGKGGGDQRRRPGPAAVQWLSYWPMFAFLLVLDPVLGEWVPHFYSCKLAVLALLALPQTRGAYLITSLLLCGTDAAASATKETNYTAAVAASKKISDAAATTVAIHED